MTMEYGMIRRVVTVAVAIGTGLSATACGSAPTPAAESSSTSAVSSAPAASETPALPPTPTDQTIFQYFEKHGATLEWQTQQGLKSLKVEELAPPGWTQTGSAQIPDAFALWGRSGIPDGQYIPRVLILVGKLTAPIDAKEAIRYGFIDSEQLAGWKRNKASLDDFDGFPSSLVEGSYPNKGVDLATSNRYVLAQAGDAQYFIQVSITMAFSQAKDLAADARSFKENLKITAAQ